MTATKGTHSINTIVPLTHEIKKGRQFIGKQRNKT